MTASELGGRDLHLDYSSSICDHEAAARRFRVREAFDETGRRVPIQPDAGAWRVNSRGNSVRVEYEVHLSAGLPIGDFADESVSSCDAKGARLLGTDIFLFPPHRDAASVQVRYELPPDWMLVHPFQSGEFEANYPNLRSLYYSVVAVGELRTLSRKVAGCELVLASRGAFRFGDRDLMETIAAIAEYQIEFFGEPVRDRYVFVMDEHPHSGDPDQLHYFGLHFDGSMSILLDARTDRNRLQAEAAHIIAHEFFHNWNGERIAQNDYDMNWFIEGVTTYYAYRTAIALRMLDHGGMARELRASYPDQYLNNPARRAYSLAEASTIVLQNTDITRFLYAGGTLSALALDLELDRVSRQRVGLDHVMRELVARADASGQARWELTRRELESVLTEMTGTDFGPWLQAYVYGQEELPLPDYVVSGAR
jgi:predicted metalloprotease with PDZ domain